VLIQLSPLIGGDVVRQEPAELLVGKA